MIKQALTRLVKELAKGTVKTSPESLAAKGALRDAMQYAKGMKEGNHVLAGRYKINFDDNLVGPERLEILQHGGGVAKPGLFGKDNPSAAMLDTSLGHRLILPHRSIRESSGVASNLDAIAGRHEIYEGRAIRENGLSQIGIGERSFKGRVAKPTGDIVGVHANLSVLGREGNELRSNPYSGGMRKFREKSTESAVIQNLTGKKMGVDRFTNKDIAKLTAARPNTPTPHGLEHSLATPSELDALREKFSRPARSNSLISRGLDRFMPNSPAAKSISEQLKTPVMSYPQNNPALYNY